MVYKTTPLDPNIVSPNHLKWWRTQLDGQAPNTEEKPRGPSCWPPNASTFADTTVSLVLDSAPRPLIPCISLVHGYWLRETHAGICALLHCKVSTIRNVPVYHCCCYVTYPMWICWFWNLDSNLISQAKKTCDTKCLILINQGVKWGWIIWPKKVHVCRAVPYRQQSTLLTVGA